MVSACHVLGLNRITVTARRKRAKNTRPLLRRYVYSSLEVCL